MEENINPQATRDQVLLGQFGEVFNASALNPRQYNVEPKSPRSDFAERLVLCGDHGPALYCHINENGEHVDVSFCSCHRNPQLCPIDIHRRYANANSAEQSPNILSYEPTTTGALDSYLKLPEPTVGDDGSVEFADARSYGARAEQLQKAELMYQAGLKTKGLRQAYCGLFGKMQTCGACEERFYITNGCENRYCPNCARRIFNQLFKEYLKLEVVAKRLVPHWPVHRGDRIGMHQVIAKVDIMPVNTGVMPAPEEVRKFNQDVRKFFRAVAEQYVLPSVEQSAAYRRIQKDPALSEKEKRNRSDRLLRDSYGVLWVNEFGSNPTSQKVRELRHGKIGNTNLHAHGCYAGPWLPNKHKELSQLWEKVTGTKAFFSIAPARSFHAALAHALKYAGKFLSADPKRLAELEVAFHRVRRVHTLGAFYNVKAEEQEPAPSAVCPCCEARGYKSYLLDTGESWIPVKQLRERGIRDLEDVRQELRRQKVFASERWDPGGV